MTSTTRLCVAFIVSSLANEGPVRILYGILCQLDKVKFRPVVFTLIPEKSNSMWQKFVDLNIEIICAPRNVKLAYHILHIRALLKERNITVLHSHCPRSLWIAFAIFQHRRICYTAHIYPGLQTDVLYGSIKGFFVRTISMYMLRRIGSPIACSGSVSREFLEQQNFRIPHIDNGCQYPVINRSRQSISDAKSHLGISEETIVFLFVGRLSIEKNPLVLAKAFESLSIDANLLLLIVGDGPLMKELLNYRSPNIRVEGFHSDVRPFYQAADFYVSPSLTEGLANTLLEGISYGIMPILSDIPSHSYFLEVADLPKNYTFDPRDALSIKNCLMSARDCDSMEHAYLLQQIFAEHFSASSMTTKYEDVYERIASH